MRLTKIYTKSGDSGSTMLGDGSLVPKHHSRVEAYGTVDEANAAIAMAVSLLAQNASDGHDSKVITLIMKELARIQNDLFDVGADLCVPLPENKNEDHRLRIMPEQIDRLETVIDSLNSDLPALESFILPGGSLLGSYVHLARTICRRAERCISTLLEREPARTNPDTMVYMNRLSDLLFVIARVLNSGENGDVLWQPGANRSNPSPE